MVDHKKQEFRPKFNSRPVYCSRLYGFCPKVTVYKHQFSPSYINSLKILLIETVYWLLGTLRYSEETVVFCEYKSEHLFFIKNDSLREQFLLNFFFDFQWVFDFLAKYIIINFDPLLSKFHNLTDTFVYVLYDFEIAEVCSSNIHVLNLTFSNIFLCRKFVGNWLCSSA